MEQIMSSNNKSILQAAETKTQPRPDFNCINYKCPLDGICLVSSIVYQATVTRQDNNNEEIYIGLTENIFKTRYCGHTLAPSKMSKTGMLVL